MRRRRSPHKAVTELYGLRDTLFQAELVEQFIQTCGIYPTGTLVELTSGEVGVVVAVHSLKRLRPSVMLLLDRNKVPLSQFRTLDLSEVEDDETGPAADGQGRPAGRRLQHQPQRTVPRTRPGDATTEDDLTGLHDRKPSCWRCAGRSATPTNARTAWRWWSSTSTASPASTSCRATTSAIGVLQAHGRRSCRAVARPQDYVARIGDNRFAMILPRIMNNGHAELAVQKLFRQLDLPFEAGTARCACRSPSASRCARCTPARPNSCCGRPSSALANARLHGPPLRFPPDGGAEDTLSEFWDLEIDLAGAIQRGEMRMLYQPQIALLRPDARSARKR